MIQSLHDLTKTFGEGAAGSSSEPHRLLAVDRRKIALDILSERALPLDVEELAAEIAAREADGEIVESDAVEQVAISLHHAHLPMMEELGFINYDLATTRIDSGARRPDPLHTP